MKKAKKITSNQNISFLKRESLQYLIENIKFEFFKSDPTVHDELIIEKLQKVDSFPTELKDEVVFN